MTIYHKQLAINFSSHEDAQEFVDFITDKKFGKMRSDGRAVRFMIEFKGAHNPEYKFGDGFTEDTAILDLVEGSFDYPPSAMIKVGDYEAYISEDGDTVGVGCQNIRFEEVEKLYLEMKKIKDNN